MNPPELLFINRSESSLEWMAEMSIVDEDELLQKTIIYSTNVPVRIFVS